MVTAPLEGGCEVASSEDVLGFASSGDVLEAAPLEGVSQEGEQRYLLVMLVGWKHGQEAMQFVLKRFL